MPRKPPDTVLVVPDDTIAANASEVMNADIRANIALAESAEQLALELKYEGSIQPDALEASIGESRTRINMELFAMGVKLLLLKEQCDHGGFMERCKRLELDHTLVNRTMQATLKFSNSATSQNLAKLSKSKIFELLVLDDEEVEQLTESGSARGITFDDIDRWSVAELRKQLREARADTESKNKLLANKNEAIDRLQTQLSDKVDVLVTPDSELAELQNAAQGLSQDLAAQLMVQMRAYLSQIRSHHVEHGGNSDDLCQGYLDYVDREIIGLKEDFVFTRYVNGMPEWIEWDQRQQMIADGAARLAAADDAQLTADEAIINGDDSGE